MKKGIHVILLAFFTIVLAGGINSYVYAEDDYIAIDINGEEVVDYEGTNEYSLPAGMSYDKDSMTLTMENVSITVPENKNFLRIRSDGNHPVTIKLIGDNTIKCEDATCEDYGDGEEVFYFWCDNYKKVIFEGPGTLTVTNNPGRIVRSDNPLEINDCTLNLEAGKSDGEIFYIQEGNLTINDSTINMSYDAGPSVDFNYEDYVSGGVLIDFTNYSNTYDDLGYSFLMKDSVLNINTYNNGSNKSNNAGICNASLDLGTYVEFHNSKVQTTGNYFEYIEDFQYAVIDNSTFKNINALSGRRFNFVNKHKAIYPDYPDDIEIYEGIVEEPVPEGVDWWYVTKISGDIFPYDGGESGGGNSDPVNPTPTTPVNPTPTTPVNPTPTTPVDPTPVDPQPTPVNPQPAPIVTPTPAAPAEIVDLPAVKISKPKAAKKKITVKWKKVSKKNLIKIQGIEIQVATDPGFTNIVKTATAGKKKTSKVIKGLSPKTKYYVRIRAYAAGNHVSAWKSKSAKVK